MPGLDDLPPPPLPPPPGIPTGQGVANRSPASDKLSAGCIVSIVVGTLAVLYVILPVAGVGFVAGLLAASDQTWEGDPKEASPLVAVLIWLASAALFGGILLAWFVIVRGVVRGQRERRWQRERAASPSSPLSPPAGSRKPPVP